MAITAADLQTELGDGKPTGVRVLRHFMPLIGTGQRWLIHGGTAYPGRVRHVTTTAADNAATQAAAVVVALLAGNAHA
jgi:hypothetical protein